MKKILTLVLIALLAIASLGVASAEEARGEGKTIGICLTSQALARTVLDSIYLTEYLEEMGYDVEIVYSEQDAAVQATQFETFVSMGVDGIIISPSDSTALSNAVEVAYDNEIPVMVYDALIMNSPYIEYYATDDLYAVGATQGGYIVDALGLEEGKGPFNLEIFSGSMTDNNATYFFEGAMDQLQPYIDSGMLVVKSGQVDRTSTATDKWSATNAQTRADAILSTYYSDGTHLDACLTQNDDLAAGVIAACKSAGYGTEDNPLPLTTGQDCNVSAILSIINGEQSSTVFKNIKELAYAASVGIDAVIHDEEMPWDPEMVGSYNNNAVDVTTYQVKPLLLTAENWYELIVESGFYDAEDLGMTEEELAAYAPAA
ncbi:MAG TPA: sugar-binding protein [Candidatus Pullichristensenella excrementigallinarum]|uniref:Sugar-binding protein n=1 Tax=Candidatus Pullichristensenella excrementigallinarum TaxID=2840907 RepID=A0A9D1IC22_9FIRM|nr:sugar-binding protein [Candidatus Pullichristensenella excrementigallinarum]